MKPHGVIEAGHHHVGVAETKAVREGGGIEQRHVAGVGQQHGVNQLLGTGVSLAAKPHQLLGSVVGSVHMWSAIDMAHLEGAGHLLMGQELIGKLCDELLPCG